MKLRPITSLMVVRHIADTRKKMTVVAAAEQQIPYGGLPVVLTDEDNQWFSAELVTVERGGVSMLVAAAVNGYGDKATAMLDAERRA